MQKFEAIIFDLGGILINLDYEKSLEEFIKIGGKNIKSIYQQYKGYPLFAEFEKGAISAQQFRDGLRTLFDFQASDQALNFAWNAILQDFPKERLDFVDKVGKTKRTFILSNTNKIHKEGFDKIYQQQIGDASLAIHFEKAYYSHLIGMKKPDTEIFDWILKKHQLQAKKTLFIDDTLENLEGAKKAGIHTLHIDPKKNTILDFQELLLS